MILASTLEISFLHFLFSGLFCVYSSRGDPAILATASRSRAVASQLRLPVSRTFSRRKYRGGFLFCPRFWRNLMEGSVPPKPPLPWTLLKATPSCRYSGRGRCRRQLRAAGTAAIICAGRSYEFCTDGRSWTLLKATPSRRYGGRHLRSAQISEQNNEGTRRWIPAFLVSSSSLLASLLPRPAQTRVASGGESIFSPRATRMSEAWRSCGTGILPVVHGLEGRATRRRRTGLLPHTRDHLSEIPRSQSIGSQATDRLTFDTTCIIMTNTGPSCAAL